MDLTHEQLFYCTADRSLNRIPSRMGIKRPSLQILGSPLNNLNPSVCEAS